MVAEVERFQSADEAAGWVHKNLPAKNTLTFADADLVEAKFRERLAVIDGGESGAEASEAPASPGDGRSRWQSQVFDAPEAAGLEATAAPRRRVATKTIRLRDKEHCKFVATQPCLVCGRTPAEVHHLRFAQPRALSRKVSDEYTVAICRVHHRELHRYGDEASWWAGANVDPLPIALELSVRLIEIDLLVSCALVRALGLQREQIIATAGDDPFGDVGLGPHGVDGDEHAGQLQSFEQ